MPSLSARAEVLEKSMGVSGRRPAGMDDGQFLRYLGEMPRPQHALFVRAMSEDDLNAVIRFGNDALANDMPPALFERFMKAYESGDSRTSINILQGHIATRHQPEPNHANP